MLWWNLHVFEKQFGVFMHQTHETHGVPVGRVDVVGGEFQKVVAQNLEFLVILTINYIRTQRTIITGRDSFCQIPNNQ
jgi:hypothetical protein